MNYFYLLLFLLGNIVATAQNPGLFEPDPSLRKTIKNEVWKELEKVTPKNQMTYIAFSFLGKMPYNTYEKLAAQEGLPHNDVATAHTFYKVVAWERLNGVILNNSQRKTIYQQTSDQLSSHLTGKTDREKQILADTYILKATWSNLTLEKAKANNDQVALTTITSTVQQWFYQVTGKLIAEVTLDSKGFKDKGVVATTNPPSDPPKPKTTSTPSSTIKHTPSTSTPTKRNSLVVKDVIMRTVTSIGLNAMTYIENIVYILYENGEIYNEPWDSPGSLDRATFKREKPKGWGTWKKQGNKLLTSYPGKGKTYTWEKWFQVRAAPAGFKMEGKFHTTDPFGGGRIINASNVTFNRKGQFTWEKVSGGYNSSAAAFSKKNTAGTYQITGYSIILNYNNAKKAEFFFGRYPKSEKHFIIGGSHFVPLDD